MRAEAPPHSPVGGVVAIVHGVDGGLLALSSEGDEHEGHGSNDAHDEHH